MPKQMTPEETGKMYDAIVHEGSKCGFYPEITRPDPRGSGYGHYSVEVDDYMGAIRVTHCDGKDGRDESQDFTMFFTSVADFGKWAKSL